jgi:hypothetical protein
MTERSIIWDALRAAERDAQINAEPDDTPSRSDLDWDAKRDARQAAQTEGEHDDC